MWRRPELLAFLIACSRTDSVPDAAPAPIIIVDATAPPAVVASADAAPTPTPMPTSTPPRHAKKAKSIGHTSVVLKIEQTDGKKIVWKPDSRVGRSRYKAEIAAYRLATLLGIDNVPPALPLDFTKAELARAVENDEKAKQLFEEKIVFDGDVVHGAFTEWIDDYAVLPLENAPRGPGDWRTWLKKDAPIPDDKKDLARAISTMIVFDYVTANWDRWSGANVATSKGKVLYVDNDAAFAEAPPADGLARNERYLNAIDRVSKSFVEKLRSLSDEEIAKAIDILSKKSVDGVLARRKKALALVEKKERFFD